MKIQKFLHSCLLVENNGKRLLIDPGEYSFQHLGVKVSDVGRVDAIIFTHPHNDHCWIPAIKEFLSLNLNLKMLGNSEVAEKLKNENIAVQSCAIPGRYELDGFQIESAIAPHEKLPEFWPRVQNNGFWINGRLFHAGDSFSFELKQTPEILAMPLMASWGSLTKAFEIVERIKPKHLIFIHDAMLQPFYQAAIHEKSAEYFPSISIQFHPLKLGEALEV